MSGVEEFVLSSILPLCRRIVAARRILYMFLTPAPGLRIVEYTGYVSLLSF
jgi:hypothetical protein